MYYDDFLHKKYNKQPPFMAIHKRLKRYINKNCIKYELLKDNPYNRLKFDRGKSEGIKCYHGPNKANTELRNNIRKH